MVVDQMPDVQPEKWPFAPHVVKLETSVIREILKISSQPGVISFAGGLPAPELFPLEDMKATAALVIDKYGPQSLQYSLSRGVPELRRLLAQRASERGTPSTEENILITAGAQQGLELIARAFVDPGDYILTENPTYVGALQAFNYYQAKYCTVDMDGEGMVVDQVAAKIEKYKPCMIYTISNFQNPTGITMSLPRRRALNEVAAHYGIPIIDDNPYGDIRFAGKRLQTLKSMGGDEVIALRTFSKICAPGLRIGWMNGPSQIMGQFEKVKQCTDLHTNSFCQYMMYEWVASGKLEPHIERIKDDYREKRDLMLKQMAEHFPEGITWTEPEGGLFLWVTMPKHMNGKELLPKAVEKKVAFVYGSPFFANGGGENTMRLNFSNASKENIVEGISRLGRLLKDNI